jgi:ABC-type cobalamin/Fe3+-siderophores transport system ATPase subunit/coproporphyrinogen III oxidase-like Fe-S oxidoreductase
MVKVSDLNFAYQTRSVLKDISLSIKAGEFLGFLGPNGSGKSTFLKNLLGFLTPQHGQIIFAGSGSLSLAKRLALVPQNAPAPASLSVRELMLMGRLPHVQDRWTGYGKADQEKVEETLRALGITSLSDREAQSLSGGELQKVIIGRCLVQEGELLLLDEATAGLDLNHTIEIMELMRKKADEEGKTIVAVLHDLNLASQYCDRIVLLKDGRLRYQGTPKEILTETVVEEIYGVRAVVTLDEAGRPLVLPRRVPDPPRGGEGTNIKNNLMFSQRFRSHHDAEHRLADLLGKPKGPVQRIFGLRPWSSVEAALRKPPSEEKSRGIYIHVPHCDRICRFCNLNRKERQGADLDAYSAYIVREIGSYGAYPYIRERPFEAVYIGGGTPTVLSTDQLSRILEALHEHIPLTADCEITVESTQHNLGVEKAVALAAQGVNRFSIGIQTFSERGRKLLGRTYSEEKAWEDLLALRAAFKGTLGIDIIYSYPDQSLDEIGYDVEQCLASQVDSVSFYSLMIHAGSALAASIARGETSFVRDLQWDRERHHLFYTGLTEAGFTLLELTKLVRPGRDAYRYIQIQYEKGDLLPLGSGAGGRIAGFQLYSLAPGRRFVSRTNETYDRYYRLLGELQFGRYDPAGLARFLGPEGEKAIRGKIRELSRLGYLVPQSQGSAWSLTPDGVFWGNNIAVEILGATCCGG